MSINYHLFAERKITLLNINQKEEFPCLQTNTSETMNIIKSHNIKQQIQTYIEIIKQKYKNKEHIGQLNNWLKEKEEQGFIIKSTSY